jgi:hypothetical protein
VKRSAQSATSPLVAQQIETKLVLRDHITAVSFELWEDRYRGRAERSDFGPHVLQSRQLRIAVGSPFVSVETYRDRPLFEHHT